MPWGEMAHLRQAENKTDHFVYRTGVYPPPFPKSMEDIRDRRKDFMNLGVGAPDLRKE